MSDRQTETAGIAGGRGAGGQAVAAAAAAGKQASHQAAASQMMRQAQGRPRFRGLLQAVAAQCLPTAATGRGRPAGTHAQPTGTIPTQAPAREHRHKRNTHWRAAGSSRPARRPRQAQLPLSFSGRCSCVRCRSVQGSMEGRAHRAGSRAARQRCLDAGPHLHRADEGLGQGKEVMTGIV